MWHDYMAGTLLVGAVALVGGGLLYRKHQEKWAIERLEEENKELKYTIESEYQKKAQSYENVFREAEKTLDVLQRILGSLIKPGQGMALKELHADMKLQRDTMRRVEEECMDLWNKMKKSGDNLSEDRKKQHEKWKLYFRKSQKDAFHIVSQYNKSLPLLDALITYLEENPDLDRDNGPIFEGQISEIYVIFNAVRDFLKKLPVAMESLESYGYRKGGASHTSEEYLLEYRSVEESLKNCRTTFESRKSIYMSKLAILRKFIFLKSDQDLLSLKESMVSKYDEEIDALKERFDKLPVPLKSQKYSRDMVDRLNDAKRVIEAGNESVQNARSRLSDLSPLIDMFTEAMEVQPASLRYCISQISGLQVTTQNELIDLKEIMVRINEAKTSSKDSQTELNEIHQQLSQLKSSYEGIEQQCSVLLQKLEKISQKKKGS